MVCQTPLSLTRPDGQGAKDRITVPCGKCLICLQNKRADWTFRLTEELRDAKSANFLTLTYDAEHIPLLWNEQTLNKKHIQLFLKRLRQKQAKVELSPRYQKLRAYDALKWPKIKYYCTGEYGTETQRPHYHMIIFNVKPEIQEQYDKIWGHGYVQSGTVTTASIHYVTKYCIQTKHKYDNKEDEFSLMSTRPPIGQSYIKRSAHWHKQNKRYNVISQNGTPQRMPRYYKDAIFNHQEKKGYLEEMEAIHKETPQDLDRSKLDDYTRRSNKIITQKKGKI